MNVIAFSQVRPHVFKDKTNLTSEVWEKNISFQKGESYLLEAASGTGKSSLCSYIYGYRSDYKGVIAFDGIDSKTLGVKEWVNLRQSSLSILFQDLRLFPELTVAENIAVKNNLLHNNTESTLRDWAEQLGIDDKWHAKVGEISFGQQQRVAFIRALCQPFDFILLDEPISHLDDDNAMIMTRILAEEAQKQGAGIIVTSIGKHLPMAYTQTWSL